MNARFSSVLALSIVTLLPSLSHAEAPPTGDPWPPLAPPASGAPAPRPRTQMRSRDLFAGGLYLSIPGTIAVVTGGVLLGTTHTGDFAKPLGGYGLLVAGAPAVAAGVIMSVVGAWQVPLRRVDGAPAVYVGPGTASLRWSF